MSCQTLVVRLLPLLGKLLSLVEAAVIHSGISDVTAMHSGLH